MAPLVEEMNILTLNCWGLKFISTLRKERLKEIGRLLAVADPPLDIVGLQELWTQEDYNSIRQQTCSLLPYGKFYYSGIFGGGLAILSKWPIVESSMFRYPLNGRPNAFYHGDWYVGKGVASARIRYGQGIRDIVEVFTTHLHAPYEPHPHDTYLCHRTAQAWEISKLMRGAAERGHLTLALGDFNMVPLSLAHRIVETQTPCRDIWRILHPESSIGSANEDAEKARKRPIPTADENLHENGACSDSVICTWRWNKNQQNRLGRGRPIITIPGDTPDPGARRLDYIFANVGQVLDNDSSWSVKFAKVAMTERHPTLGCSVSDHFAVQTKLVRIRTESTFTLPIDRPASRGTDGSTDKDTFLKSPTASEVPREGKFSNFKSEGGLPIATYGEILDMVQAYTLRQRRQRRIRLGHFPISVLISIGCLVSVWFVPNYGSFLLMLLSTANIAWGVIDGLQGGLFVGSELRALKEFEWEIHNARSLAGGEGIPLEQEAVRDWYD